MRIVNCRWRLFGARTFKPRFGRKSLLMVFAIAKFISGLFGWDISKVQKYVILGVMGLIVVVVIAGGLWFKSCRENHRLKVYQKQVEKINKADEKERKAELQKVIDDNADVITTNDQRSTIAQANEDQKQAQIYSKIQEADQRIADAKAQGRDVSQDELECILVPAHCK